MLFFSTHDDTPQEAEARARLSQMISRLKPDREYFAGRIFFEKLLAKEGPEAVMDFLTRASKAMDEGDGLDIHLHFNKDEEGVFKQTYLNVWTRRAFLNTAAWAFPGAVYYTKGLADTMDMIHHQRSGTPAPKEEAKAKDEPTPYGMFSNFINDTIYAPAELVIGLALMNEAKEKWVEIKLEQIGDAVETLGNKIKLQQAAKAEPEALSR